MNERRELKANRITELHDGIEVRPASSPEELEAAYGLVYRSYLRRSYMEPNPNRIRFTVFNAFPRAATFVGVLRDQVIATVSLVPDTPAGLPMDEVYHDELQNLRDRGRRVAEVTMLADRRMEIQHTLPMLLSLMKLLFDYAALFIKSTDLCITINPRHDKFYRRYLLFTQLGGLRPHPGVRDNPAVARRLDLECVRQRCEGNSLLLRLFYRDRTPLPLFEERYRMTQQDLRRFLVELSSALRQASAGAIEYLRGQYPECPWDEWQRVSLGSERGNHPILDNS